MKNPFIIILIINSLIFAQSINKKYLVEENISGGSESVGEYNIVEYSIKSVDDKLLYKISNKTDYDIPYAGIELFDNGSSVLISSFYGTLTFFSNHGTKLKELKLSEALGFEYERSIKSIVDNNTLLVIYQEDNSDHSTLKKYNSNGTLEKSFELEETNINGLAYSKFLNQIYISSVVWGNSGSINKVLSLINEDGELLKSYNANFEKGFFGDSQFIAFSNKSLLSINTKNLEINFQNKQINDEQYLDVTLSNKSIVAITAKPPKLSDGKWFYKNPSVIKMDLSGKLIEKSVVEINSFSKFSFKRTNAFLQFIAGYKSITIE